MATKKHEKRFKTTKKTQDGKKFLHLQLYISRGYQQDTEQC